MIKTVTKICTGLLLVLLFTNCNKESNNAALTGNGSGGSTARFTIAGNYLYVVDHTSVKSFLISDPNHPQFKSKTEIGWNIETIFPYQDKLFIGSSSTLYIYSLDNPASPRPVGYASYQIRMSCDPVVVKGNAAYAALRAEGPCGGLQSALMIYDISAPSAPVLQSTVNVTTPYGLGVKGDALYLCNGSNGLSVFDVSKPFAPEKIFTVPDKTFYDVIPYDSILICQVSDGFALYDIATDPLKPVLISTVLN